MVQDEQTILALLNETDSEPTEPQPPQPTEPSEPQPTPNDELAKYHESFQQEFTRSSTKAAQTVKEVNDIFLSNSVDIATRLVALACGAKSDQTKFAVSKYILDTIKEAGIDPNSDPFSRLLEQLQVNQPA